MARASTIPAELSTLAHAKLASSGLTPDDARILHIDILTPEQTQALHPIFKPLPSIKLNYTDPATQKPQSFSPAQDPFYRLRYLKLPTDIASVASGKPQRYAQEPVSGICAYFPTITDWTDIINDPRTALIITEGELKAACACKFGYPTIGLGGVQNFRSSKLDCTFLPDLERVNWKGRNVYIVYDSDFRSNANICDAANALAEKLYHRGAMPHFVPLPDVISGGKTGLDDFLVHEKGLDALGNLIHEKAESLTISRRLWELNDQIVYVHDPGLILVKPTGQRISPTNFVNHAFSNLLVPERTIKDDGTISLKDVPAASKWLQWHSRADIGSLTYRPGQPKEIIGPTVRESQYNIWPGWGCRAQRGDASLFITLVDHLFTNANKEDKRWFIQWLAYPLQHPGTKLFTCVAIHSKLHGLGKSLVAFIMGQIYGKNFTAIKQPDLHNSFTEWAENKQFVLVDDITGTDKRNEADMFKGLITQKEVRINIKYVPSFTVPDCMNLMLTSNQPDMVFLESDDRRFFVHEVTARPLPDEFYKQIDDAMKAGILAPAVFDYLLKFDVSNFNPNARARLTASKQQMISDVRSDLGAWVERLATEPDLTLRVGRIPVEGDLFSNRELLDLYDPEGKTRITANGMGRELRRSNIEQYGNGAVIQTSRGRDRYYIVRNVEKWEKAKPSAVIKHLEDRFKMGMK